MEMPHDHHQTTMHRSAASRAGIACKVAWPSNDWAMFDGVRFGCLPPLKNALAGTPKSKRPGGSLAGAFAEISCGGLQLALPEREKERIKKMLADGSSWRWCRLTDGIVDKF
jgi:hypothetical protein